MEAFFLGAKTSFQKRTYESQVADFFDANDSNLRELETITNGLKIVYTNPTWLTPQLALNNTKVLSTRVFDRVEFSTVNLSLKSQF